MKTKTLNMEPFRVFGRIEPTRESGLQKYTKRKLVDTVIYHDKKGKRLFCISPLKRLPWNTKRVMVNCFKRPFSWIGG